MLFWFICMDLFDSGIFTDVCDRYFVFDGRGKVICCKDNYEDAERAARRPGEIITLRAYRTENDRFTVTDILYRDQKYFGTNPTLEFIPILEVVANLLRPSE